MNSKLWSRSFGINTDSIWPINSSQTPLLICLRTSLVWKEYLLNKPWKSSTPCGASTVNTNPETQLVPSPINQSLYMEAIRTGQQVLIEQGSKASAAMEIFKILKDESRDVVLQAFIEGANITPKGSPTYFYNVTRKLRKQKVVVWTRSISWDNGSGFFKEYRKIRFVIPKNSSGHIWTEWVETPTPTVNQIDGWDLELIVVYPWNLGDRGG